MTFLRYIIIQLFAYVLDMSVFWVALNTGIFGPIVSNICSKIAAGTFAVFAHKSFTFSLDKKTNSKKLIIKYFCLLGLNIPLSSIILVFVLFFIDNPVVSKIMSDIIYFIVNYLLCKFYIFSPNRKENTYVFDQVVKK